MAHDSPVSAVRARWVFPVAGPPISGGVISMARGKIVAVGSRALETPAIDLGDVALVPGLVNAHTHLEFSDLARPLGRPGMALPDWIAQVIAHRRASADLGTAAIAQGLAECVAEGTTALGEIATSDWPTTISLSAELVAALPRLVAFRELIAPTEPRVAAAVHTAQQFSSAPQANDRFSCGLSPHAPYTVHQELLTALAELAERKSLPLAMHLAESPEELELIANGSGPFRDLLIHAGAWDDTPEARLPAVIHYLERLARAPRALVIHGNYLRPEEIEFLAARASRMTLVYCPRTHAFFQHAPYHLAERLAAGVSVALGTDSRASNPNLSLLEEMRFVVEHDREVSPATVLTLGTLAGARALGLAGSCGTLEAGKQADFAVIGPMEPSTRDPYEALFAPGTRVAQTWIGAVPVRSRRGHVE